MIRQYPELKIVKAKPMENVCYKAKKEDIEKFLNNLGKFCTKYPTPKGFVFNIDESGFQEWSV